jgi:hypothetical protein
MVNTKSVHCTASLGNSRHWHASSRPCARFGVKSRAGCGAACNSSHTMEVFVCKLHHAETARLMCLKFVMQTGNNIFKAQYTYIGSIFSFKVQVGRRSDRYWEEVGPMFSVFYSIWITLAVWMKHDIIVWDFRYWRRSLCKVLPSGVWRRVVW